MKCEDCLYYVAMKTDGGRCHRYAPRPLTGGSGTGWADWEWPKVPATSFCGEFVEKDDD